MQRLTADSQETASAPRRLGVAARAAGTTTPAGPSREEAALAQQKQAFEQAREQGRQQGLADAQAEIKAQVDKIVARMREEHAAALQRMSQQQEELRKVGSALQAALKAFAVDAETLSVEVAFAAVARLLGDKAADRTLMTDLCQRVVQEFGHPTATLRVSESDFALLQGVDVGIPVETDRRLSAGQCVIDTARGQFESGLDVRLDLLRKAVLATVAEHRTRA